MDMLSAGGGQARIETQTANAPAYKFSRMGDGIGHRSRDDLTRPADPEYSPATGGEVQRSAETHGSSDLASIPLGEGPDVHTRSEGHSVPDVGIIVALWRQRQDIGRAYQRLDLQCQAVIRRYSDGDKAVATKRWAAIQKGADDEVAAILVPYQLAMAPLAEARHALELQLAKRARALPLWTEWAKGVRGLGELSLAGLIGEAGRSLTEYRSVSALWKRMGLAVIGGERQRRIAGDAAILHGYAPQRRAYAYVLSTNLMRSQKAEDPYRALYDTRKAYELARDIPKAHAHNRALRVMVKALLRDAWAAERVLIKGGAA